VRARPLLLAAGAVLALALAGLSLSPLAPWHSRPDAVACVRVRPGDNLQAAVDAHPAGTTFCLGAGVHRLATAVPKDGQRFVGEGAATRLNGAKVLAAADARRDAAGRWFWGGQTQQSKPHGKLIDPGYAEAPNPGDAYAEELFVTRSGDPDDPPVRFRRVTSLAELGKGRWLLDQAADRIYLAEDPARLGLVETSVPPSAIAVPPGRRVAGVLVSDLVVEKYASPTQLAALGGAGAVDWTMRRVTVRYNHGAGAELGPGTLMEGSKVHHMGQEGLIGGGDAVTRPTVLRDTEVAYNKTLSFDADWEAGGAKLTRAYSKGLVVENCWFHHNAGAGLWLDMDNHNVVVRSNRFQANDRWGVFYEVSRAAKIYWNEAFDTGNGPENHLFNGAGIYIANSADVEVFENVVYDNANGIFVLEDRRATRWGQESFRDGLPHVQNVVVRDNDVRMFDGFTGMRVESGDARAYWRPGNVRFFANTYRFDRGMRFYGPGNDVYTFDQWQGLGNDRDGRRLSALSRGTLPPEAVAFSKRPYGAGAGPAAG
jgi:Right handed beta helix region